MQSEEGKKKKDSDALRFSSSRVGLSCLRQTKHGNAVLPTILSNRRVLGHKGIDFVDVRLDLGRDFHGHSLFDFFNRRRRQFSKTMMDSYFLRPIRDEKPDDGDMSVACSAVGADRGGRKNRKSHT